MFHIAIVGVRMCMFHIAIVGVRMCIWLNYDVVNFEQPSPGQLLQCLLYCQ